MSRLEEGALYWRPLDDGYEVIVYPMMLGRARLCFGEQGSACILNAYCYDDPKLAIRAAAQWDGTGDPLDGWTRNPITGRRRIDGDPAREVIRP